jgi:protein TonB
MSYVNQAQDPRRRAGALAGTVAINAAIGLLVVTGLQFSGMMNQREYRPIVDFPTPKPPPPQPDPEPTKDQVETKAPTPTAPLPPLPFPPAPGPKMDEYDPNLVLPKVDPLPGSGSKVGPPPLPSPSFVPKSARPSNDSSRWITTDDYPRGPLVDGSEGIARYRLVIGTNGSVSSCEVTASTGDKRLDQATCRHLTRRARFEAATDETGAKVMGTYTGSARWEIPE